MMVINANLRMAGFFNVVTDGAAGMVDVSNILNAGREFYTARLGGNADCGRGSSGTKRQIEFHGLFEGRYPDYDFDDGGGHRVVDGGEIAVGY
jgi:hypothetical protein